jgi:hypothetical protein
MKRWKKAVAEWNEGSDGSIQPVPKLQGRRKNFDCNGDEPWKKHGKRHCAEEGKWPCYRTCLKDTISENSPIKSGKCKKFCKKHGKPQVSIASPICDTGLLFKSNLFTSLVTAPLLATMTLAATFPFFGKRSRTNRMMISSPRTIPELTMMMVTMVMMMSQSRMRSRRHEPQ